MNKQDSSKKNKYKEIAKYAGLGSEIVGAVLVPIFVGQYLDKQQGNIELPVFTLIFAFFGIAYVIYKMYKISSN